MYLRWPVFDTAGGLHWDDDGDADIFRHNSNEILLLIFLLGFVYLI